MTSSEPTARFDPREMFVVHDVFRREFALMPGLIAAVPPGDRDRSELVGDHIGGLMYLLHHHHGGEDAHVWPLLMDRCPDSVAPLGSMHHQHEQLATLLDGVSAALAAWRVDAAAAAGQRLTVALDRTLPVLRQHLEDEERYVVPLMERYLCAAEWDDMVQKGVADADPAELPLSFGMLMYEGDPEIIERVLAAIPAEARPVITALAAQTFAEHSRAVHGTPTPPRSSELDGARA